MLLRRRVFLPSASGVAQRVHHEAATHTPRIALQGATLPSSLNLPLLRAMHTTPPIRPQASSSTVNGRWKRGRPVTSGNNLVGPMQKSLSSRLETSTVQSVGSSTENAEGSNIVNGHFQDLQSSSKSIHLTSTNSMRADYSTFATITPELEHSSDLFLQTASKRSSVDVRTSTENAKDRTTTVEKAAIDVSTERGKTVDHSTASAASASQTQTSDSDFVVDEIDEDEFEQDSDNQTTQEDVPDEYTPLVSFVPLAYQIPHDVLRTAQEASPNTRASYWNTNLYRGPKGELVSTHYCQTMEVADRVAQYFLEEKVVGFDIEWKPWGNPYSIKQNASLIQLACENRIALFHIALFPGTKPEKLMPPNLRAVLESPNITKVGVAIKSDFKRLEKYLEIQAEGVFELSRLHNLVEWYEVDPSKVSNRLVKLATQVLQHLHLPLYKGEALEDEPDVTESVRESDWSKQLDRQQIHYAAGDAYVGFRLYHVLEWKRKRLRPTPPAIQFCDYDTKPAPRSKELRKSTKSNMKKKYSPELETEPIAAMRKRESEEKEETEDAEDAEGFETASEELMDTHQLDHSPNPPTLKNSESDIEDNTNGAFELKESVKSVDDVEHKDSHIHKRVGKVRFSWIPGPDPGYPFLPANPDEATSVPSSSQLRDKHSFLLIDPPSDETGHSHLPVQDVDEHGDEFADSELEEAMSRMDLDGEGKLREMVNDGAEKGSPTGELRLKQDSRSVTEEIEQNADATSTPLSRFITPESDATQYPPQYIHATNWAQTYLRSTIPSPTSTSRSHIRATLPHLRAYHMWKHQNLSLDDVARHLREPPLATSTVASYIAQAIHLEKLDYDKEALRNVVTAMPPSLRHGRWRRLSEQIDAPH